MLAYWKWAVAGALVAALVLAGWVANGWRIRAAQASDLQKALRTEIERAVLADAARLGLERKVETLKAILEGRVETVKETVVRYVKQNPACDLPEPVAGQLQRLRQGRDVPPAPAQPADPG